MGSCPSNRGLSVTKSAKKKRVSAAEFIKVWNKSESAEAFGSRVGMDARSATTTASLLRWAGRKLKIMKRGRPFANGKG